MSINYTKKQAFAEATPAACREVLSHGFNFAVAVETATGRWFLLNTIDMEAAHNTARQWVDIHGARGASIWRIYPDGLASKKCGIVYEDGMSMEWGND